MVYNSTYNKNNWRNGEVQKKQSSNFRLFYEFILWHLILHMTIIMREKKTSVIINQLAYWYKTSEKFRRYKYIFNRGINISNIMN
jgi:hypothetical protein